MKKRINSGKGFVTISTTVSPEFYAKAKQLNVSWSEALRKGLAIIFSEMGDEELQNPYMATKKIQLLAEKLSEFAQKNEELSQNLEKYRQKS